MGILAIVRWGVVNPTPHGMNRTGYADGIMSNADPGTVSAGPNRLRQEPNVRDRRQTGTRSTSRTIGVTANWPQHGPTDQLSIRA